MCPALSNASGAEVAFVLHHRLQQSFRLSVRGLFDNKLSEGLPPLGDKLADFCFERLGIVTGGQLVALDSHGFTDEPTPFQFGLQWRNRWCKTD